MLCCISSTSVAFSNSKTRIRSLYCLFPVIVVKQTETWTTQKCELKWIPSFNISLVIRQVISHNFVTTSGSLLRKTYVIKIFHTKRCLLHRVWQKDSLIWEQYPSYGWVCDTVVENISLNNCVHAIFGIQWLSQESITLLLLRSYWKWLVADNNIACLSHTLHGWPTGFHSQ